MVESPTRMSRCLPRLIDIMHGLPGEIDRRVLRHPEVGAGQRGAGQRGPQPLRRLVDGVALGHQRASHDCGSWRITQIGSGRSNWESTVQPTLS